MMLLHPIMPFITEEIWQRLNEVIGDDQGSSIMISAWPAANESFIDDGLEAEMRSVQSVIGVIRNIRNEMNVPLTKKADVVVAPSDDNTYSLLFDNRAYILDLAKVNNLTLDSDAARPPKSAVGISDRNEVFVLLEGLVDIEVEKARIKKEIERRKKFINGIQKKLNNEGFLSKAPENVIKLERRKLEDASGELEKLMVSLDALGA
jgi:valyl-tRNA synthetase